MAATPPISSFFAKKPGNKRKAGDAAGKADDDKKLKIAAEADEPFEIGSEVKCKIADKKGDSKWYMGAVVKYERWGMSKNYAVKAYYVVFDNDKPCAKKLIPVDSYELVATGNTRTVRYWSSGTPCMRSTGFDHAVKTTEQAAEEAQTKTKKKGKVKYVKGGAAKLAMERADAAAAKLLASLQPGGHPTTAQITKIFGEIGSDWPTQDRPNVTPNGKPVTGFCLGAVYVLGGVGMATSNVSLAFPNLCKSITAWVRGSLPESNFPFSSIQINYNYMARKHVDGNNIGPSFITAIGDHEGGGLWTADKYIHSTDPKDGSAVVKGGGGEAILDCRGGWHLFNGNVEHETQPVKPLPGRKDYTRVSVIVFSNSNYNRLPGYVVDEMEELGFTAQSSDGEDLPYFKRYRLDKKEFNASQNKTYMGYLVQRCVQLPAPIAPGRVAIECFGLTMNRGGGWMSFADSSASGKARVFDLEPNRTGLHVLELDASSSGKPGASGGLTLVNNFTNNKRFDTYKDEVKEVKRFADWVDKLPNGRVVLVTITDTAIAAKRPPGPELYRAFQSLGGELNMERIGYRQPFAFIGVKGSQAGSANQAMDKTKILLRLEATVLKATAGGSGKAQVSLDAATATCERTDITELMLSED